MGVKVRAGSAPSLAALAYIVPPPALLLLHLPLPLPADPPAPPYHPRQGQQHRTQLLERLTRQQPEQLEVEDVPQENPLDGCLHVFLDLGSNRGLQIRKLYEPHLFPLAPVLPLYERYFGQPNTRNNQQICAVGFEPNPAHTAHLQAVAANYSTCSIKVIMFTETGVSNKDAVGSFAADLTIDDNDILHDGGAR